VPFDGIVTARNVDVGTYVANVSGNQLFVVARISPIRIYVQIPQAYAPLISIGMEGDLTLPEFPGRIFQAHVTNTAGMIDQPPGRSKPNCKSQMNQANCFRGPMFR
jgi:multidrug efflux system membrane fusion protein